MRNARSSIRPRGMVRISKGRRTSGLANGGLSTVTMKDEPDESQNAERASEDIGNVANRTFKASAWDTTLWVDSYRGG